MVFNRGIKIMVFNKGIKIMVFNRGIKIMGGIKIMVLGETK